MSLDYVKNKIEFYQDFPIDGVKYLDLNPLLTTIDSFIGYYDKKINNINNISESLDLTIIKDSKELTRIKLL